jgi:hypothetical protein
MTKAAAAVLLAFVGFMVGVPAARADFGVRSFSVTARNSSGAIDQRAGSHPFAVDINFAVDTDKEGQPEGRLREVRADLPPGLLGNPRATPRCPQIEFQGSPPGCAAASQIGVISGIATELGQFRAAIYNLAPLPGDVADFGIETSTEHFIQRLSLPDGGIGSSVRLTVRLPSSPAVIEVEEELWGVPANQAHDAERSCGGASEGCSSEGIESPLITLPTSCSEAMRATLTAVSVDQPPVAVVATALSTDSAGNPRPLAGCESAPFDPRLTVNNDGDALAPTGLNIALETSQYEGSEQAAAALSALRIDFPEGLALNLSAASWLTGCPLDVFEGPGTCPGSSRLGTVTLRTPLVDHPLHGSIYLASPAGSPSANRYGIYLTVDDEASGVSLRIPGSLAADDETGRLDITIPELPQFPFEELEIKIAGGARAPLTAPSTCGTYLTEATFTPSSAPFSPLVSRSAAFGITAGPGSSSCPPPEAGQNATPSFKAGTVSAAAGADSPFVIQLSREDTDQHFGSFQLGLPPGLLANLGSVPLGSAVGSVELKAGVGPEPLTLDGTAFLGGPYRGAPYSLEAVLPSKAGPFELGTITERAAVGVDPGTGQITIAADTLPRILDGVPLQLRSLSIDLDRPGFIRNPTSCGPTAITGSATSSLGRVSTLSVPFKVANCRALPFRPKLSLRLLGATGPGGHPGVRAVMGEREGEATPVSAAFALPAGELLDLRRIRDLCPQGIPADRCPPRSRLGSVSLKSSYLPEPLTGSLYLRVPSHRLPDLVASLHSPSGSLEFSLRGRTTSSHGRLGIKLESLPDVPFSSAVVSLAGGRSGIVVNSRTLCGQRTVAQASLSAHNGARRQMRVPVRVDGCR